MGRKGLTGDITATGSDANTDVTFKNCAPFTKCITHINDEHIDTAKNIDITMPMYNLIEYSNNYSDTSRSLWQFKRDELPVTMEDYPANATAFHGAITHHRLNTNQVF